MSIDEVKSQNVISDLGPNLKIAFILGTAIVSPVVGNQNINFHKNIFFTQNIYSGQDFESDILYDIKISIETSKIEKINIIQQFAKKLLDGIEELNPNINKLVDDNFWELR